MRRTRAALLGAATALVSARGTANVPVSDIADAAGVSRQLVYLHYGDRDTLLLEAALDLARRDLAEPWEDAPGEAVGRDHALAVARHFAAHQGFYRAMFATASAFALNQVVSGLLAPLRRESLLARFGGTVPDRTVDDLAVFVTGGGAALMAAWLDSGEDPLDPEAMADRLQSIGRLLTTALETHAARN
ncbi:TetR/AcrR family transcriptional regulator [Glycomyces algeriensis]|uniref:TetR family transcriptional regulator n=1 Tax=Glycomyces algeriensis TaxID=256037 RepID=A0A9W6GCY9_9ACTN|nr:TetR family transcriptional regulator [Glycomyces algeriensis]MDA1368317.1 TetR family transcriptional regulator [Glycomyces algeriensis]MDR7351758.1 AcrR family transcriptional regulator [Glycomyces algeriensis]GLI44484.1 TetR family transcriptional regulator [Glycomyces algeriensis]